MEIPFQRLEPETLRAVITEYVTRESTEYGDKAFSLDEKIASVQLQLENGNATIVFDTVSETCNVVVC
jgi:uncharacterized protein YheU (UPF0270 family)